MIPSVGIVKTIVEYLTGGNDGRRAEDGERGRTGGNTIGSSNDAPPRFRSRADVQSYAKDYIGLWAGVANSDILTKSAHDEFVQRLRTQ